MKKILLLVLLSAKVFAQVFSTSDLPIVIIDTENQTIYNDPKIKAKFTIIYNGKGKRNDLKDKPYYDGFCGIELRGSSSQMFPKKPYGLELWNNKGEETEASLFGFPKESDFILFASYHEKSFMHNVLTMKMAREMNVYASRTQYVELVINGEYLGLYVFMEKIKEAKGRVEIADLKPDDIKGDALTGGYIIKIDKSTGSLIGSWLSKYSNNPLNPNARTTFFYEYPKSINTEQKNYIRSYIDSLETVLYGNDYDPQKGYRKFLDTHSFVKYLLLNEVSKNVDGYRISTFMYKDKNSKGGKLKAGPPWDYDITYGNANYCDGNRFDGFAYNFNSVCPGDFWTVPFWWDRLLRDPTFVQELRDEYVFQRKKGALQLDRIYAHIDSMSNEIKEAQARNFQKWRILGIYVWPQSAPYASTWEGEVNELRNWIRNRIDWLDNNLPGVYGNLSLDPLSNEILSETALKMEAFPNPFIEKLTIQLHSPRTSNGNLRIFDESGKELFSEKYSIIEGENQIEINIPSNSMGNLKFLKFELDGMKVMKKLIQE